jgi:hypothetical protein
VDLFLGLLFCSLGLPLCFCSCTMLFLFLWFCSIVWSPILWVPTVFLFRGKETQVIYITFQR